MAESISTDESMRNIGESSSMAAEIESQTEFEKNLELAESTPQDLNVVDSGINTVDSGINTVDSGINTDGGIIITSDLFIPFIVIGLILGGLSVYYL